MINAAYYYKNLHIILFWVACDIDISYCFYGLHGINLLFCFAVYLILYNYICCLANAKIKYFSLSLSFSLPLVTRNHMKWIII